MKLKEIYSALPLSDGQVQTLLKEYPIFETSDDSFYCLDPEGREELLREFTSFLDSRNSLNDIRELELVESSIFSSLGNQYSYEVKTALVKWMLHVFFDEGG
jgi:hypothetical protein